MKRLVFCVTNDLNYDQRMIRICHSLQEAGFNVLLIGREYSSSPILVKQLFSQKRLSCFFKEGKLFYIEYNIRLFFFLLFVRMDLVCAIDLDTILPCYFVSLIRKKNRVYDAHELFCEMKEIVTRPAIYKVWKSIEKFAVPKFDKGYTVCTPIKNILYKDYGVEYEVIMNMPFLTAVPLVKEVSKKFIIYQGAVNHGRSFETLIPAFQWIDCELWIYGDGNFMSEAIQLTKQYHLEEKVLFKGKFQPNDLKQITPQAVMGITLFENNGLSNYLSLANRFFDYMHACIPQVVVNYPSYKEINKQFEVAVLIDDTSSQGIAKAVNQLLGDNVQQKHLKENCLQARQHFNWEAQEKKLIRLYENAFTGSA